MRRKKGFGPPWVTKNLRAGSPWAAQATQGFHAGVFGRRDDNSLMTKGGCPDTRLPPLFFHGDNHCRDTVRGMTESLSCLLYLHAYCFACLFDWRVVFWGNFFGEEVGLHRGEGWGPGGLGFAVACHVKGFHGCASQRYSRVCLQGSAAVENPISFR